MPERSEALQCDRTSKHSRSSTHQQMPMSTSPSYDATTITKSIRSGKISAREICVEFLERITTCEPRIHAFAHLDPEAAIRMAESVDSRSVKGPLAGVPIGVKDIFDTVDMPTEYNSPIYEGHRPSRDCSAVARLRAKGAVVIGKTATTEFAFMHTGPTRNPFGRNRTPGSSSAGSAAGMAAGFFPIALGTQTAGSLIKPASYCGSFAYKPTFGRVSMEGVKPLAPSMDTIGWFGRSVEDLRLLAEALLGEEWLAGVTVTAPLKIIAAETDFWDESSADVREVFRWSLEALRDSGHEVQEVTVPFDYRTLAEAHKVINDKEGARSLRYEYEFHRALLSDSVLKMIDDAHERSCTEEMAARAYIQVKTRDMMNFMKAYDVIVTPSTAHEAPEGLAATGTSNFIKTWNALGVPQVNVPVRRGRHGLPIGLQLVGAYGNDSRLLEIARTVSAELGVETSELAD